MTAADGKSNTQILQEPESLSESSFQPRAWGKNRRTASLTLRRSEASAVISSGDEKDEANREARQRSRRMSVSSWLSYKSTANGQQNKALAQSKWTDIDDQSAISSGKKSGIWNWKPIRALTHLGMQKLRCLFSVQVMAVKGLPPTMNGLRLAVCVRKEESRDGTVQTMPSRLSSQGSAEFEETLFIRCHVYFSPGKGLHMKFEPRPFQIYVLAVDAADQGLDFGKSLVDLSSLIQESIERSFDGMRIRQWDRTFGLSGKGKGGELVVKLGFQIMEKDGGIGIYSPSSARKQSKTSFSVPSARISIPKELVAMLDEDDLPEFDMVDRGVEIKHRNEEEEKEGSEKGAVLSGEVVKEVVQDQLHLTRMKELDSIAQQIKALESVADEKELKSDGETGSQKLDAEEYKVTREFLKMLDDLVERKVPIQIGSDDENVREQKQGNDKDEEELIYVPDLGKGLGCVVQTRNGGYLAAVNPSETPMPRKDKPKLAIQMSKPLVIKSDESGFEVLQKVAGVGFEELTSEILNMMPMDELMGKPAEQIAFEGIASEIIQGRKKEGASSSAARTIAAVKSMAAAMNSGRKERALTGIWNVGEEAMTVDEILAFTMHKMETMAVEALKIQADVAEEAAPFDISPIPATDGKAHSNPLASAVPIEDWIKVNTENHMDGIIIAVVVQLRDPLRLYEPVGGHMMALIEATSADDKSEEKSYRVASLQLGGIKVRTLRGKNAWDGEKQKLTALQWLAAHRMGKAASGKRVKVLVPTGPDMLWSISSRVVSDLWLKPVRNPNIKFN